jgi:hypothetical protein
MSPDTTAADTAATGIWILETNLDDCSGEIIGHTLGLLIDAGALDAYSTPIQMKKNRPAVKLTVLCQADQVASLELIIFRETTTLGIRRWPAERTILERRSHEVVTCWGTVVGILAVLPDGSQRFSPEYEPCREISQQHKVPLAEVYRQAALAYQSDSQQG